MGRRERKGKPAVVSDKDEFTVDRECYFTLSNNHVGFKLILFGWHVLAEFIAVFTIVFSLSISDVKENQCFIVTENKL